MRPTPQVNRPIGVSAPEIPDLNALPLATAAAGPNTGLSFVPDPVTLDTWQVGIHPALEPTPAGLSPGDPGYMPWHAWYDDQNGIGGGTCGPADIARLRQEVERHEGVTLAPNSHLGVANTVLAAERPERRLESLYTDVSQAELRTLIQGELTNFFNRGAYRRAQDRFDRQDTPTVFAVLGCTLDFNASVRAALLLAAAAVPTGASWFPLSYSWDQLVSVPLPACKIAPLTDIDYAAQYALPAGYVQRVRAVMDQLGGDERGDPAVRTMAACLARYITP